MNARKKDMRERKIWSERERKRKQRWPMATANQIFAITFRAFPVTRSQKRKDENEMNIKGITVNGWDLESLFSND